MGLRWLKKKLASDAVKKKIGTWIKRRRHKVRWGDYRIMPFYKLTKKRIKRRAAKSRLRPRRRALPDLGNKAVVARILKRHKKERR